MNPECTDRMIWTSGVPHKTRSIKIDASLIWPVLESRIMTQVLIKYDLPEYSSSLLRRTPLASKRVYLLYEVTGSRTGSGMPTSCEISTVYTPYYT